MATQNETPLKYTGASRPAKLKEVKTLLRRKVIDTEQFAGIVRALNREERKAIKRQAKAETVRAEKEAERIRVEREAEAKKEAERQAKKQASIAKAKAKRKARRQVPEKTEKGDIILTITYSYRYKYKNDKPGEPIRNATNEASILVSTYHTQESADPVEDATDLFLQETANHLHQWSPIILFKWKPASNVYDEILKWEITNQVTVVPASKDKNQILMRDATALGLDGHPIAIWDTKQGCCVYDFLIWRYGNVKGGKRFCTYEGLDNVFGAKARLEGVCVYDLEPFCDKLRIRMYALDEMNKIIHSYVPKVASFNNDAPPLIFMVKDNHFYAIMDRNTSISQIGKNERRTELQQDKPKGEVKEKTELAVEIVNLAEGQTELEFMVQEMKKNETQVYPFKNIHMSSSGLRGFTLNEKAYMFGEDQGVQVAKKIAELWGESYKGESVNSLLVESLTELKYDRKSAFNPRAFKVITDPNVKWRTHYGSVGEVNDKSVIGLLERGDAICADITKAYTACVSDPLTDWLIYDFSDEWTAEGAPLPEGELPIGLYFVETTDLTLLHSTNVYSDAILNLARKEGIQFKVISYYKPSRTLPKDYYKPLMERFEELTRGQANLKKVLVNTFTGFLGKHKTERYVAKMNTDADVVWNDFSTEEFHKHRTFMYKVDEFYIYGYVVPTINAENNIPQYIQILDWANIRLFKMIQESGGSALWRKTDCAIILGGSLPFAGDDAKPGDYRKSDYPETFKQEMPYDMRAVETSPFDDEFVVDETIRSSNQIDEVFNLLMERKGLVNVSRAGTGKSYNLLALEKKFLEKFPTAKVVKLAFTNKACLNIRGTTIHKFLKMNSAGKFNLEWVRSLAGNEMLIEIDEISMIGSFLWRRLVELKKALPKAYFLLCGDYRQVPPVESGVAKNYFECSALKWLASYTKIEFVERQRYDKELWDVAERLWELNSVDFSKIAVLKRRGLKPSMLEGKYNICYFNSTRKMVNASMNQHIAKKHRITLAVPYEKAEASEDPVDEVHSEPLQQDVIIYEGLPIISHKNKNNDEEKQAETGQALETANNEAFTVVDFTSTSFTAKTERINDLGEMEEHIIELPIKDFHSRFLLNYCATTHKTQGATISDDIVLWDFNEMSKNLKYTAITRAKKLAQVSIVL